MNSFRLAALLLLGLTLYVQPATSYAQNTDRNRQVGLVLGGGGAKGLAHIGVLQFLEANRIPVDFVVGTSMGAIAGGLYVQGNSPDHLEELVLTVDWQSLFNDEPPRRHRGIRRKEEDRLFPVQATVGFSEGKFKLPQGVIQGQQLMPLLRNHSISHPNINHFDNYYLRFRATAADIESGELLILEDGDIALAMRASMAIPGVFSPVNWQGRHLVDGGMVNNLPIDIALEMGATHLIVVDVGEGYPGIEDLNGPLAISEQAINLMIRNNTLRQLKQLRSHDIHLTPDLFSVDVSAAGFGKAEEAIRVGYEAAEANAEALKTLQVSEGEWENHINNLRAQSEPIQPQWFRLLNESNLPDELLWANMSTQLGSRFREDDLSEDIERIYGLGYFEQVDYQVLWEDQIPGIEVRALPRSWGPNYLSFGLTLEENFDTQSSYRAAASYLQTGVNPYGAELQYDLQVGNEPLARVRYWQPLRRDAAAYASTHAQLYRNTINQFVDGELVGSARVSHQQAGVALGTHWRHQADIRVGYIFGTGQVKRSSLTGSDESPDHFQLGKASLQVTFDTLDSVFLPQNGHLFEAVYNVSSDRLLADRHYNQAQIHYLGARSWGNHTWVKGFRVQSTVSGTSPPYDNFTLGGFMNLSGHQRGEFSGQHVVFGQLAYLRRLSASREFGTLPTYLGVVIESGNAWDQERSVKASDLMYSGSAVGVITTPFGAVYLGLSHSSASRTGAYLAIGRPF